MTARCVRRIENTTMKKQIFLCVFLVCLTASSSTKPDLELAALVFPDETPLAKLLEGNPFEFGVIRYKYVGERFVVATEKNWQSIRKSIAPVVHAVITFIGRENSRLMEVRLPSECPDWVEMAEMDCRGSEYTTAMEIFGQGEMYSAELKLQSQNNAEQAGMMALLKSGDVCEIELWIEKLVVDWEYSIDEWIRGQYVITINKTFRIKVARQAQGRNGDGG